VAKRKTKTKRKPTKKVIASPSHLNVLLSKASIDKVRVYATDSLMHLNALIMSDPVLSSSNHERLKDARKNLRELVMLVKQETAYLE
jgi:hypothetical protein